MWRGFVRALVLENIQSLEQFQRSEAPKDEIVERAGVFVCDVIHGLPWYFRLPVQTLAAALGLLCCATAFRPLASLSSERRHALLRRVRRVPAFGMLNKLVRATAFLHLFDYPADIPAIKANVPAARP